MKQIATFYRKILDMTQPPGESLKIVKKSLCITVDQFELIEVNFQVKSMIKTYFRKLLNAQKLG